MRKVNTSKKVPIKRKSGYETTLGLVKHCETFVMFYYFRRLMVKDVDDINQNSG